MTDEIIKASTYSFKKIGTCFFRFLGKAAENTQNHIGKTAEIIDVTMKTIGNLQLTSFEEVKDEILGKVGTQRRDDHERSVEEALQAYRLGEAIKQEHLTPKGLMVKVENESQYDAAMTRIEELLPLVTEETPDDDIKSVELVYLSNLVADYDDEHYPIKAPSLVDVLRLRMYEMNLTQKALAAIIGISPARLSEILSGRREPTLDVARNISTRLSIDASIVLGVC